jgi:hypothetical protein
MGESEQEALVSPPAEARPDTNRPKSWTRLPRRRRKRSKSLIRIHVEEKPGRARVSQETTDTQGESKSKTSKRVDSRKARPDP